MWGGTKDAARPVIMKELSRVPSQSKNAFMDDMNFLNRLLWPYFAKRGVRQHDSFACARLEYTENVTGTSTGWPHPRAGGEHVGAVYLPHDKSREGDLAGLPRTDTCKSKAYNASSRSVLCLSPNTTHCSSVPVEPVQILLGNSATGLTVELARAYVLPYVFIENLKTCSNGTQYGLPTLFDYDALFLFPTQRDACKAPQAADIPQYHERIPFPSTQFDVFKPHGINYARQLYVIDALYSNNVQHIVAEGLPMLAFVLANMLPGSRILLHDSPAMDAVFSMSPMHWLLHNASLDTKAWRGLPWVCVHSLGSSLSWAYRVVAITSDALRLTSISRGSPHFLASEYGTVGSIDLLFAQGAVLFDMSVAQSAPSTVCWLGAFGANAIAHVHRISGQLPRGWQIVDINTTADMNRNINAVRKAAAVLIDAAAPPMYLGYTTKHATVYILASFHEMTMPLFCAQRRCVHVDHNDTMLRGLANVQCHVP